MKNETIAAPVNASMASKARLESLGSAGIAARPKCSLHADASASSGPQTQPCCRHLSNRRGTLSTSLHDCCHGEAAARPGGLGAEPCLAAAAVASAVDDDANGTDGTREARSNN